MHLMVNCYFLGDLACFLLTPVLFIYSFILLIAYWAYVLGTVPGAGDTVASELDVDLALMDFTVYWRQINKQF